MRVLFALIPLSLFIVLNAQEQLGSDIDGEAANDYFGYHVSLDSDGDRVAIAGSYLWIWESRFIRWCNGL